MIQRDLTLQEKEELALLNKEVDKALSQRKDWLDKKMVEIATLKPGDEIYDLETHSLLGIVTDVYRYKGNGDEILICDYLYQIDNHNSIIKVNGNTSSKPLGRFGSKKDVEKALEFKLYCLKNRSGNP
jgi:hypothetical protein